MTTETAAPTTIDEYIATCAPEVRPILQKIRETIRRAAPEAGEKIGYGIPTFTFHGNLVHFGAFKHHIGFYPPVRDEELRRETDRYAGEKGNLQFPLSEPMPYKLITRIVKVRVRESLEKAAAKGRKKQSV